MVFEIQRRGEPVRRVELQRPTVRIGASAHADIVVAVQMEADTVVAGGERPHWVLVRPGSPGSVETQIEGGPRTPIDAEVEIPCGSVLHFGGDGEPPVEVRLISSCSAPTSAACSLGPIVASQPTTADSVWVQLAMALNDIESYERLLRVVARYLVERGLPDLQVGMAVPGPSEADDDSLWQVLGDDPGRLIPPRLLAPGVVERDRLRAGHAHIVRTDASASVLVPLASEGRLHAVLAVAGDPALAPDAVLDVLRTVLPLVVVSARRVRRHEELVVAEDENRYFRTRQRRHDIFKDFVAESPSMRQLHREMSGFVANGQPVLLRGEAGTGKELLARALHHLGSRRDGLYIAVHCGSGDEQELEIELFGLSRTDVGGASMQRRGVLELGSSGTIFLDEVHLLGPSLQARLMRAISEGEIFRVGESQARRTAARLVAATHHDLLALADEGRFRRDLAVLFSQQSLIVPPLRRRREDFEGLCSSFVRQHARRYRKAVTRIDPECLRWLSGLQWPGNVRELQTVLERAVLQAAPEQSVLGRADFELR